MSMGTCGGQLSASSGSAAGVATCSTQRAHGRRSVAMMRTIASTWRAIPSGLR